MPHPDVTSLPVGFIKFHGDKFINYQLNRLYATGFGQADDLHAVAGQVKRLSDCPAALARQSEAAERAGRLHSAVACLRGAEFFTPHHAPERLARYRRYRALFDQAVADVGVQRAEVPYGTGALPTLRLAARGGGARGTVLLFGGFDSLIEEFFCVWERIAAAGFDVIAFEGPGQGGARALWGLPFEHDWERPVGALLDHFGLSDVALVGMSMGGYWALRAAAHEPRVSRVVAWPPVYDWLRPLPAPLRPAVRWMMRWRAMMNASIRLRARLFPVLDHTVRQALYIQGLPEDHEPIAIAEWFLQMNAAHLCSAQVTQDVLLLVGEHDAFQPARLAGYQAAALTGARRVQQRTFTAAEHADQHCQMGNLGLACAVLTGWLEGGTVAP